VRIGIVNDVPAAREALRRVVAGLREHEVAWTAADGLEAVTMAERDRPDLILMDLIMPGLDGVEATRRIMHNSACAILVVTATVSGSISLVYEAMGHGALDAIDTPVLGPGGDLAGGGALAEKISMIAKLVGSSPTAPAGSSRDASPILLAIGASTGGPRAISELLAPLPTTWNVATVIVQHVDVAFAAGLADWLGDRIAREVRVIKPGHLPRAGEVLIAGTNDHLVLSSTGRLEYTEFPRDVFYRPSVDVFFTSLAEHWRRRGVGVLLTGMGRDGAAGLGRLRDRGWHTIAQDEASSVVWGMPKAAAEAGAAVELLPIHEMAAAVASRLDNDRAAG